MAVLFDEIVSQVEVAPPQPQPEQEQSCQQRSPRDLLHCWQVQQAIVQRRQQRLEAD